MNQKLGSLSKEFVSTEDYLYNGIILNRKDFTSKYIPLKYDVVFKSFFSDKDNKKFLVSLLNHYLNLNLSIDDEVLLLNTELVSNKYKGKNPRLDLRLRLEDGQEIDLEIQVENHYNLIKRIEYYNSKMYSEQIKEGEDYSELRRVISLIFVFHDVFKNDLYINNILPTHIETGEVIKDSRWMCYIELGKYLKYREKYEKDEWAELLVAENETDFNKILEGGGIMADAVKKIKEYTQEEKDAYWDDMMKKAELDRLSNFRGATRAAELRGRNEGIKLGKAEGIVFGLLMAGLSDEEVIKKANITESDLEKYKEELSK